VGGGGIQQLLSEKKTAFSPFCWEKKLKSGNAEKGNQWVRGRGDLREQFKRRLLPRHGKKVGSRGCERL